jgi:outer membrane protein OmpA-like peptidoglycan-associated protein
VALAVLAGCGGAVSDRAHTATEPTIPDELPLTPEDTSRHPSSAVEGDPPPGPRITVSTLTEPPQISAPVVDYPLGIDAPGVDAKIGICELEITLDERAVQFGYDSDQLDPAGIEIIRSVAKILHERNTTNLHVIGHTSEERPGDPEHHRYNMDLSWRRARHVAELIDTYLAELGSPVRVNDAFTGKGSDEPVAPNDTEHERARNRRVVITAVFHEQDCPTRP